MASCNSRNLVQFEKAGNMLKNRFAGTILKSQKQTLFVCDGDKIGRLKSERQEAEAKPSIQHLHREREGCDLRAPSRADMLKKRFADTITKAQKQTLFVCDGDEIGRLKLERKEAEAKASMQRRQREREASRIAIENMDRSAAFEDNISILSDLADMIGDSSFAGPLAGSGSMYCNRKLWRPLERFGLYLKEDDYD